MDEISKLNGVGVAEPLYPSKSGGAMREKLNHPRYDYAPIRDMVEAFSKIAIPGAEKYATDNWKKGLDVSQITGSLQRHLWAFLEGEDIDAVEDGGTGEEHINHVLWNAVALVWMMKHKPEHDDRFPERLKKNAK